MKRMRKSAVMLCSLILLASCTSTSRVTTSGSEEWSRGVILDSSEVGSAALATWEDTTFVAWISADGKPSVAQLNASLSIETSADLNLTATHPQDLYLVAESAESLHLTWEDRVGGNDIVVYAHLIPGQAEPLFSMPIPLPDDAHHIQTVVRPEEERIEVFWSDLSGRDSGLHHLAMSFQGDELASPAQITEGGWQPAVGWGPSGTMHMAWVEDAGYGDYVAIWQARFNPQSQTLEDAAPVAEVRDIRGFILQGPAVGSTGDQIIVTWSVGRRNAPTGDYDAPGDGMFGENIYGGRLDSPSESLSSIQGDMTEYVMVSSQSTTPAQPLTGSGIGGTWKEPHIVTVDGEAWAVYSGWLSQRGNARLQIVVAPFNENGPEEHTVASDTWQASLYPDMTVGADGTLRAAWVEAIGEDQHRIVVASTANEAKQALGGFMLSEWLERGVSLSTDVLALLFFAPYIVGWTVLGWGLVAAGTYLNPDRLRGWWSTLWLWAAIPVHLACKRYIAPALMPIGPSPAQLVFVLTPVVIGLILILIYWRRAETPSLMAAYGLFAASDAVFSLFVALPQTLWN